MNPRSGNSTTIRLFVLLAWACVSTAIWLVKGWGIQPPQLPPLIGGGFSIGAIFTRLVASGSFLGLLLLAGVWVAAHRRRHVSRLLTMAIALVAGIASAGTICAFVAFWKIDATVLWLISIGVFLASVHLVKRASVGSHSLKAVIRFSPERVIVLISVVVVGIAALAPQVESDGLRYHLVTIQEWVRAGSFVKIPYNANSNLPALGSVLVADYGFILPSANLLQVLQWANFCALIVFGGAFARQLDRSMLASCGCGRTQFDGYAARTAGLLVAGIPVVGLVASWPFVDVGSAAQLIAAAWAFTPGSFRSRRMRVLAGGLFTGAAVATKISNLPIAAMICAFALFLSPDRSPGRIIRDALLIGGCVLVIMAPWLIKNWMHHGNPVYPLAYGVFGGPEWSAANDAFYKAKMAEKGLGHDVIHLLRAPFDVTTLTMRGTFEQHNPGPAFLAMLPACLLAVGVIRKRRIMTPAIAALLTMIVGYAIWFKTYQSARFLMPILLLSITLGVAVIYSIAARLGRVAMLIARGVLGVIGALSAAWLPFYLLSSTRVLQTSLGLNSELVFITTRFATYPAIQWLNKETQRDEPVFYIGEFRSAYAWHFKPISSDWFDTPRVLVEIQATENNDALLARWRRQGIRYVLLNLRELSLYEALYFRPRFTNEEWRRFSSLRETLLKTVAYDNGDGIIVADIGNGPGRRGSSPPHDPLPLFRQAPRP
ncbi:hypothetical protein IT570_05880 [Candidatus Sumerlaeota bacterium]|nr:hypothetical protein [Candidatus Sumerlaeota bacterium]